MLVFAQQFREDGEMFPLLCNFPREDWNECQDGHPNKRERSYIERLREVYCVYSYKFTWSRKKKSR